MGKIQLKNLVNDISTDYARDVLQSIGYNVPPKSYEKILALMTLCEPCSENN